MTGEFQCVNGVWIGANPYSVTLDQFMYDRGNHLLLGHYVSLVLPEFPRRFWIRSHVTGRIVECEFHHVGPHYTRWYEVLPTIEGRLGNLRVGLT